MLFWIAIFINLSAQAEYRAFELVITDPTSGQERVVISNMNPGEYRRHRPVKLTEKVTYRATWMCRGNTSNFKPICPKPEGQP